MVVFVNLLGFPTVRLGDTLAPRPRDRKTWGALAYLLLASGPVPRRRLSELLFPDVDDPLASVRWTLASIRRLLDGAVSVEGDPIVLSRPAGFFVDTDIAAHARWSEAVSLPSLDRDLLEGMTFDNVPAFDLWLIGERRRLRSVAAGVLHEAVLATLARDPVKAVGYSERLVSIDPFDENGHVSLVRALMAAGQPREAARRVDACVQLFQDELGAVPTGALHDALTPNGRSGTRAVTGASVRARLDIARAAVAAGSWAEGIDSFRRAVSDSRSIDAPALSAQCLVGLGSALVHAARGYDEEGAASLHEGGALADQVGESLLAATAWRELAWVEVLRARYERASLWLGRASAASGGDPTESAWIKLTSGVIKSDTGDNAGAIDELVDAIEIAESARLPVPAAFARSFLGRVYLLRGDLESACQQLERSVEQAKEVAWTSLIPWPEALLAEVELRRGNVDFAEELFEHAFSMGRQLGDPCWESMGARGLGIVAALRGDVDLAVPMLEDAGRFCRRLPDSYLWVEAYALDSLCAVAVEHSLSQAPQWIEDLTEFASRSGFREMGVRALLYRARLGDPAALTAAVAAADRIDNPSLLAELGAVIPSQAASNVHSNAGDPS